jgi:hypothetical protein
MTLVFERKYITDRSEVAVYSASLAMSLRGFHCFASIP